MAMYNKIITFLMLTFIVSISFAQQYTPMTAAGYQYKRAKVDSTLHIPSFCGVPNLRNSTVIQGALAMDTCGNKLYQWTHAAGWSTISTNAIDSLKRSNDSIFARKSGVWVFQYKDSVGGGGATPSLQDVATVGNYYINDFGDTLKLNSYDGNNKHPLLWVNDQYNPVNILDFSYNTGFNQNVASIKFGDSTNTLATGYIKITDKESYFRNELSERTIIQNTPSISGSNQITYFPLMKGGTDTLATTEDIRNSAIDTSNKWVNNIYRTSGVDSIYYTIGSTTYAIKDSAGGGSSQNGRFGNDTATVVMAKVHNDAGVTLTNGKVVAFSTSGTNSNAPSVKLANNKGDSTSANTLGFVSGTIAVNDTGWVILSGHIEKLNTAAYSNGDIIYLDSVSGNWTKTKPVAPYHMVYLGVVVKSNAGNGSIFVKCQNGYELDEIHDVQITSKQNNQILVYSDTQKIWKNRSIYSVVDTTNKIATKTNLALKLNISDSATMLTPYLRKIDTASLSSRIDLRVKYTDTATMLTPYLRNNTASATYLAKSDSSIYYTKYRSDTSRTNIYNAIGTKLNISDTANKFVSNISRTIGKDSIIFNIGSTRYAIKDSVGGGGTSYTFSTGLTNSANTITNNLSTGVSGGQSVVGGTAASNSLTLSSTSNATKGKILFGTSAYDEVNNRLGIGTTSPSHPFHLTGSTTASSAIARGAYFNNTLVAAANNDTLTALDINPTFTNGSFTGISNSCLTLKALGATQKTITTSNDGDFVISGKGATSRIFISGGGWQSANAATGDGSAYIRLDGSSTGNFEFGFKNTGTLNLYSVTSGNAYTSRFYINGSTGNVGINTTTDAGYKLDVNGTARVQGALNFNPTNTAAGTTGNQTINKASGTVNIAAAGTTVTVTNSLVTASSIVFAVIRTNDATATIKNVVPASGSFTINLNAATTAETSIGFFVIN